MGLCDSRIERNGMGKAGIREHEQWEGRKEGRKEGKRPPLISALRCVTWEQ